MNLCEYGANMRIRVGYVRYAKVILPQMRFRRANMVRMCENLGEHVRPDPYPTPNMRVVPALDSRIQEQNTEQKTWRWGHRTALKGRRPPVAVHRNSNQYRIISPKLV